MSYKLDCEPGRHVQCFACFPASALLRADLSARVQVVGHFSADNITQFQALLDFEEFLLFAACAMELKCVTEFFVSNWQVKRVDCK